MKPCTQCGTQITSDSPQGLCARCLLSAAMQNEAASPTDTAATQPATPGGNSGALAASVVNIADAAEVARRLPQFEILELLGRGGMGVVYKARQIQLDRIVALKILPPTDATSPGFVERFRREARSLAKLSHPNIVSVYDFGESNGLYYFVMEFVDGLNLRQMIQSHRLTASEALAIVPKICDALQFAHEEGVVHRDIKPENILIDRKGRVKIADFGLAKLLGREEIDPRLTVSGATLGTPRYMAPEQLDKPQSVDHRADIYSLGVVFYEMLTGELPMGRFAPPSQKVQIDVRLDEIVLHALERDVALRYQHASQVRDDVQNVTNTKPVAGKSARKQDQPPPIADYVAAQPTSRSEKLGWRIIAYFLRDPDRWWVIGTSVALFVVSLFLPAAYFSKDSPHASGWPSMNGAEAFRRAFDTGNVIWLANPALWVAWLLLGLRRRWLASIAAVIAFMLAVWVLIDRNAIDNYMTIDGERSPMGALRLQSGYACWLASTAIFALGALFLAMRRRRYQYARAAREDVAGVTNQPATLAARDFVPVQPAQPMPPPLPYFASREPYWLGVVSLCAAIAGLIIPILILIVLLGMR